MRKICIIGNDLIHGSKIHKHKCLPFVTLDTHTYTPRSQKEQATLEDI